MAIQIPNAGTGNGATGDNEFVLWTKVINNFSDQTNAASKLVGIGAEQVPLTKDAFKAAFGEHGFTALSSTPTPYSFDTFPMGSKVAYVLGTEATNSPPNVGGVNRWHVETIQHTGAPDGVQLAYTIRNEVPQIFIRTRNVTGGWFNWYAISTNKATYSTTTASGANVVVTIDGELQRSTSSERYKDILAPLELDDARYEDAMALKPIVYRSTADADNPAYHYYSFSAEELGAYDPAFTLWRETETVTDADGNVTEQPLAERQAEGININALLAISHAIAIKQDKLIKSLEARIDVLEAK